MEPWWFLEPLLYTSFIFAFIGFIVSYVYDKATDGMSFVPAVIAMIAMIPSIIWVLLAGLWLIVWMLYAIWSPFV